MLATFERKIPTEPKPRRPGVKKKLDLRPRVLQFETQTLADLLKFGPKVQIPGLEKEIKEQREELKALTLESKRQLVAFNKIQPMLVGSPSKTAMEKMIDASSITEAELKNIKDAIAAKKARGEKVVEARYFLVSRLGESKIPDREAIKLIDIAKESNIITQNPMAIFGKWYLTPDDYDSPVNTRLLNFYLRMFSPSFMFPVKSSKNKPISFQQVKLQGFKKGHILNLNDFKFYKKGTFTKLAKDAGLIVSV